MKKKLTISAMIVLGMLLGGCATYPSGHHDPYGSRYDGYGNRYQPTTPASSARGVVTEVDRVYLRDRSTGVGAVIGAIAGGVLGSTVGRGDGRTAATVAGAVAGGVAGDAIERHDNRGGHEAWRFSVRLDDGRYATVTQFDNPGFQRGDRVVIRGDHLDWSRR